MRYCRIKLDSVQTFVAVEQREGEDWVADVLQGAHFPEAPLENRDPIFFKPFPLREAKVLSPVIPSKIVCVGRNYRDHAAELGNDVPKEPLIFLKPPSSVIASGEGIRYPKLSSRVDFEGELGIVIGKRASRIGPDEDVRQYIRGYTLVNDVTARDLQKSDGQWTRGKGFDTFCPVGPFVSSDIDPISGDLLLETYVNGVKKQSGNTRDLIFPIPELLRYITACMTLEPGDLIPTGTPAGVGPLQIGDSVEIKIEGLGVLVNTVTDDDGRPGLNG